MSIDQSPTWKALQEHKNQLTSVHMRDLFAQDPKRFEKFHATFQDILLDYSKNIITEDTMKLLFKLVDEVNLKAWIEKMFTGEKINITENRAVLHIALRNRSNQPIYVDGKDVMPEVKCLCFIFCSSVYLCASAFFHSFSDFLSLFARISFVCHSSHTLTLALR